MSYLRMDLPPYFVLYVLRVHKKTAVRGVFPIAVFGPRRSIGCSACSLPTCCLRTQQMCLIVSFPRLPRSVSCSMTCPHCQYPIPASAKAQARREMKEAALHHGAGMMANGGTAAAVSGGGYDGYQQAEHQQQQQQAVAGGADGMDDSAEKPRQKRKRQSTKKGLMTATEEELAELDEGLSDDEPVSWRKSANQRRAGNFFFSVLRYCCMIKGPDN